MSARDTCRDLIRRKFRYIIDLTAPQITEEVREECARWFANTMMYIIELFVEEWKMPTPKDLEEMAQQVAADALLRDALEGGSE